MDGTPRGRRGLVPRSLIGMLALVAAAERWVAAHPRQSIAGAALLDWRMTGRAAGGEAARRSAVLVFGVGAS